MMKYQMEYQQQLALALLWAVLELWQSLEPRLKTMPIQTGLIVGRLNFHSI